MRKILLGLALVVVGSTFSQAQETLWPTGLAISANNQTQLERVRQVTNRQTCTRLGRSNGAEPNSCTQADACTALGCQAAGGAGCTAAQAQAAGCEIYANTTTGRERLATFLMLLPSFNEKARETQAFDYQTACATWNAKSQANKNIDCVSLGLPNGCRLCP